MSRDEFFAGLYILACANGLLGRAIQSITFESWMGAYSDNPRAISEALAGRNAGFEQIWATAEAGAPPNSRRYLDALGRVRYVVNNLNMPDYFRKKPGTTFLQTWHGTPLKRIGFDIERPSFPEHEHFLEEDWVLRPDIGEDRRSHEESSLVPVVLTSQSGHAPAGRCL